MFKKLSKDGLKRLFEILQSHFAPKDNKNYSAYVDFVKKYYPAEASHGVLTCASEYDDEYYQNRVHYLAVFDADGKELFPKKGKEKECRLSWDSLPIEPTTEESMTGVDIAFRVNPVPLPDVYIEELEK